MRPAPALPLSRRKSAKTQRAHRITPRTTMSLEQPSSYNESPQGGEPDEETPEHAADAPADEEALARLQEQWGATGSPERTAAENLEDAPIKEQLEARRAMLIQQITTENPEQPSERLETLFREGAFAVTDDDRRAWEEAGDDVSIDTYIDELKESARREVAKLKIRNT